MSKFCRTVINKRFKDVVEHYLSLRLDKIDSIVWDKQTPNELTVEFHDIESEWKENRKAVIDIRDDVNAEEIEKLIEFPDGSAWFDLDRSSCYYEGDAMGHCGNTASNRSYETVLSYRIPVDENGRKVSKEDHDGFHWKPLMTFILDTRNGMLGEMKGRNNDKPPEKLHPQIIALLRLPIIKGIIGGGYAPENNFSMDDLDSDIREKLIEEKPNLGTVKDLYDQNGDTPELRVKITSMLDEHEVSYIGFIDTEKFGTVMNVDHSKNLGQLFDYMFSVLENAKWVFEQLREGLFDIDTSWIDTEQVEDFAIDFADAKPEYWKNVVAYATRAYPEDFEQEYSEDSVRDVIIVLKNNDDELYDEFRSATSESHRAGTEAETYKAFMSWLNDPFHDGGNGYEFHLYFENEGEIYVSPVEVVIDMKSLVDITSDPELMDDISIYGWGPYAEPKDIDPPYYGYHGYDADAGIEYLIGMVDFDKLGK